MEKEIGGGGDGGISSSSSSSSAAQGVITIEECETMIQRGLRTPMAKFLIERLEKAGCGISRNFFRAVHCDTEKTGSFVPGEGIIVCSNHMKLQDTVNQVINHELIHAYDQCRAKDLDWTNCAHLACSEIRAAHLSGDCHYKREFLRGFMKIRGHEPDCVKRRVLKSMRNNPCCSEEASKDAMEAVWDTCYNDTKPFDRAP